MAQKKNTELAELIERTKANIGIKTKEEVDQYYRDIKAIQHITQTTDQIKKELVKHAPELEKQIFSFMPTETTRISPFFPLSKREMRDRPLERLSWDNAWGRFTVTGERLSIYDESVLLAVLVLMWKHSVEKERNEETRGMIVAALVDFADFLPCIKEKKTSIGVCIVTRAGYHRRKIQRSLEV